MAQIIVIKTHLWDNLIYSTKLKREQEWQWIKWIKEEKLRVNVEKKEGRHWGGEGKGK